MNNLATKISELKLNLINKNLVNIKKNNIKLIKVKAYDINEVNLIKQYNYYVRLTKRLKKYMKINDTKEIILEMMEDRLKDIICIATNIEKKSIDIGIHIQINIITGNECSSMLDCTYYNTNKGGKLHLNNFESTIPNKGYGSIILKNLDNIVYSINRILIKMKYEEIELIEGIVIPNKNIISKDALIRLYSKYDFEIDNKNNLKRLINNKIEDDLNKNEEFCYV